MSDIFDSSSDSEENSQNDSEYNFIPGVYEFREVLETNEDADINNKELEQYAYGNEPLADAEWLKLYRAEEKEREEKEEELVDRLTGLKLVESWCKCGNCNTRYLENEQECFCCREIEECSSALSDKMVLEDVSQPPCCVTLHPGFRPVCLEKWSLRTAAAKYKRQDRTRYKQTGSEASFLRSVAYREFTYLIHGYLGNKRVPMPSCVYNAIREQFKDENEQFTGYKEKN